MCINKTFGRDTGGTIDLTCPHLICYGTMMVPLRETVKVAWGAQVESCACQILPYECPC